MSRLVEAEASVDAAMLSLDPPNRIKRQASRTLEERAAGESGLLRRSSSGLMLVQKALSGEFEDADLKEFLSDDPFRVPSSHREGQKKVKTVNPKRQRKVVVDTELDDFDFGNLDLTPKTVQTKESSDSITDAVQWLNEGFDYLEAPGLSRMNSDVLKGESSVLSDGAVVDRGVTGSALSIDFDSIEPMDARRNSAFMMNPASEYVEWMDDGNEEHQVVGELSDITLDSPVAARGEEGLRQNSLKVKKGNYLSGGFDLLKPLTTSADTDAGNRPRGYSGLVPSLSEEERLAHSVAQQKHRDNHKIKMDRLHEIVRTLVDVEGHKSDIGRITKMDIYTCALGLAKGKKSDQIIQELINIREDKKAAGSDGKDRFKRLRAEEKEILTQLQAVVTKSDKKLTKANALDDAVDFLENKYASKLA